MFLCADNQLRELSTISLRVSPDLSRDQRTADEMSSWRDPTSSEESRDTSGEECGQRVRNVAVDGESGSSSGMLASVCQGLVIMR
jgi:hypothetical protein